MKHLFKLLLILGLIIGCSTKQKYFLNGKVELIHSEVKEGIEIRLYNDVYKVSKDDIVKLVKTDKKGIFKLLIPNKNTKYKIHVSYPNYESFRTDFILIDDKPELNVKLNPAAISSDVKAVSIVGDFNNMNWDEALKMKKIDKSLYEIKIEYEKPKMRYQFLFDTEGHSFSDISNSEEYEYDHGGDYYSIANSDSSSYKINVNLNTYPRYYDSEKKEESIGVFHNSPVFNEYNNLKKNIEKMDLIYYFSILIYEHQDEKSKKIFFRNSSDERIADLISEANVKIGIANTYIDSMLAKVNYSQSKDYLLDQKLYLKKINRIDYSFTNSWDLFNQIDNLSITQFNGSFDQFIYKPEFKEDEKNNFNIIKEKIRNSYEREQVDKQMFYFYSTLARYDKYYYKGKKYSCEILKVLNEIEPNLTQLPKEIETLKNKVHLNSLEFAPEFSFNDIEGESYKLSDFKGKWVFLDFWATWCAPCEMEIENIKKVRQKISKEDLVIIGVAWESNLEKVKEYVKKQNKDWIITLDSNEKENSIRSKYGVSSIPSFFLIDDKGKIINSPLSFRGENMYYEILRHMDRK